MKGFSKDMNGIAAVLTCALVALAGCAEQPTQPSDALDDSQFAKPPGAGGGGKGGGQATYEYTFSGNIQSPTFTATASSKDPFGVDTDGVTLHFPTGTLATGCAGNLETDWGLHAGVNYTGSLRFSAPKRKTIQVLNFLDDANTAVQYMNLAVQLRDETSVTKVIANPTSTLTFTNATALVGAGSSPDPAGGADGKDRCVTFTITAVLQ